MAFLFAAVSDPGLSVVALHLSEGIAFLLPAHTHSRVALPPAGDPCLLPESQPLLLGLLSVEGGSPLWPARGRFKARP